MNYRQALLAMVLDGEAVRMKDWIPRRSIKFRDGRFLTTDGMLAAVPSEAPGVWERYKKPVNYLTVQEAFTALETGSTVCWCPPHVPECRHTTLRNSSEQLMYKSGNAWSPMSSFSTELLSKFWTIVEVEHE